MTNAATITEIENKVRVAAVETLIADLVELNEESFIVDVTKVSVVYDALTAEQKDLVANVSQLETAELRV